MYLRSLVPETMTWNVKRITSGFWPSLKQSAFPLDAAERVQMAMGSTNNIMNEDSIQLCDSPHGSLFWVDVHFFAKI